MNNTKNRAAAKGLAVKKTKKTNKPKDFSSFGTFVRRMLMKVMQTRVDPRVQMQKGVYSKMNSLIKNIVNEIVVNSCDVTDRQNKKTVDAYAVWCAFKRLYPAAATKHRNSFDLLMVSHTRKHKSAKAGDDAEKAAEPKAPKAKRVRKERKGKAAPVEPSPVEEEEEHSE